MKLTQLILATLLLFVGGCSTQYKNKITPTAKEKVDLKPYAGIWKVTKMFGKKAPRPGGEEAYASLKIEGELLIYRVEKTPDFSKPNPALPPEFARLVRLGNDVIAFEPSGNQWVLVRLRLATDKKQLTVDFLNDTELKKDIESGKLKGTAIYNAGGRYTAISVMASEKELRSYLTNKAPFVESIVLTRIS